VKTLCHPPFTHSKLISNHSHSQFSNNKNIHKEPQTSGPIPQKRLLHPSSMLQLACNYGHESDSDTEDTVVIPAKNGSKTSKLLPVTGQLDSLGRIVFDKKDSSPTWQTEEQREALESYRVEAMSEAEKNKHIEKRIKKTKENEQTGPVSRKRRLAIPGGRYNKMDHFDTGDKQNSGNETEYKPTMSFVQSSTLPGTIENATIEAQEDKEEDPGICATELVEKLEQFKVEEERVSPLKTLAIKLETLYSAWCSGALSLSYLNIVLSKAKKNIEEAERKLDKPPWKAVWDRDQKTYKLVHETNGEEYKEMEGEKKGATHYSPPPLPLESDVVPPLPPQETPQVEQAPTANHQLQDMEIDEEPPADLTDELSNFYSEIGNPDLPICTADDIKTIDEFKVNSPGSSASNSAPNSPVPPDTKKRRKVKVSNNIALKKKGVVGMLAKWQNITN